MKTIFKIMCMVDNFLYHTFSIVTSTRRNKWHRDAIRIQYELDNQHNYEE